MSIDPTTISALLATYTPHDELEAAHLRQALDLAAQRSACVRTHYEPGHFTASAFLLDAERRIALIDHPKLHIWLQPGGHLEPEDRSAVEAAARELEEETGLRADPATGGLFDVDIHQFPARGNDPAHLHFDLRFLFTAHTPGRASDAHAFRWATPREILNDADYGPSMKRPALKAMRV